MPTAAGALVTIPVGSCAGASSCPIGWTGGGSTPQSAQPVVAGGVVFAGASDGTVTAFDADGCGQATCAALWTSPPLNWLGTQGGAVKGMAVAGGSLYVGRADGLTRYST